MKLPIIYSYFLSTCILIINKIDAQTAAAVNYDEANVGAYSLPDPLELPNGKKVASTAEWEQTQRPYLLKLFSENLYGKMPGRVINQYFRIQNVDSFALNGKAIRKQVSLCFSPLDTTARMDILLYLPRKSDGKVPVFI